MTTISEKGCDMEDEYGIYEQTESGMTLTAVDQDDDRRSYEIRPGTEAIDEEAFDGQPGLEELFLPASLRYIPEGALSNSGGWSDGYTGIIKITMDPANDNFEIIGDCFCEKQPEGEYRLLRVLGDKEKIVISGKITTIGKAAFKGHIVQEVFLEGPQLTIWFPSGHAFHLSELLECFGGNGKLYDFERYDRFLMQDHYNPERIKMACERIKHPYDMDPEALETLKAHVSCDSEKLTESLMENSGTDSLEELASVSALTKENIDKVIEEAIRTERADMLSWLMNYKNENFGNEEFDFTI
ncbi:MAG: hypothetical protein IKR00_04075 [Lachnospiraceae bacterium]|nr:hypothetical protein [Lachnospiraceae bacterium]